MALNKFEKHIKKKFQGREILPSSNVWDKLNDRLNASRQPKKKSYFWYGIAANFIGLLMVSLMYFNNRNSLDSPKTKVVDSVEETEFIEEHSPSNFRQESEKLESLVTFDEEKKMQLEENVVVHTSETSAGKVKAIAITKIEQEDLVNIKIELQLETGYKSDEIVNAKILEVVAQVRFLESENTDLTDAEVDSLLWKAQTEIVANKMILNGNKVDPMALLTDIEDQLDQSFRDKLFERLKTGFVKVRTAVADSDN